MPTTGNDGAASLHCVAVRVTQLAADGSTPAANQMYVTDSLVKIDFNPDIESGPETVTRNAAGGLCIMYKLPDVVKRLSISIEICTPDPELEAILSGGTVFVSGGASGTIQGYQYPAVGVDPVPNGVSIEAWTHAVVGDHVDPTRPYMHWVFPKVANIHKTNRTIDINPMANAFDGHTVGNPNWGNGPANDWMWDSTACAQWSRTNTFPTPQLGAQAVPAQV